MYERGNATYAQLLFESKGFSDMMNKAEYIEKLYSYDRRMLERYEEARKLVEELKERLEDEESELEAEEFELSEEKADLEVALKEKKAEAENFEVQIAKIKQDAAQYQALVKQQNAQIKKLEAEEAARRAAEEARRKAEEEAKKKNNSSSSSNNSSNSGKAVSANVASIIANANGSSKGKEIANFACQFIGNPYVAGGTSLTNGADCSGFTQAVYKNFGYSIPRNSSSQREYGKSVSYDEAQPGDIICYSGHVALYIGNGKIVHASTERTGIKIGDVNYKPILSVRRIV